jgi:hypothetical protein
MQDTNNNGPIICEVSIMVAVVIAVVIALSDHRLRK